MCAKSVVSSTESKDNSLILLLVPNEMDQHQIRGFSMEQFELQKPISYLIGALKRNVNLAHVDHSEQLNKTHYFRKMIFVTITLYLLHFKFMYKPAIVNGNHRHQGMKPTQEGGSQTREEEAMRHQAQLKATGNTGK